MSQFMWGFAGLLAGGPLAVVVKATLILAGSALAALVLRRAAAAFRHLIWLLGLSACVALVAFTPSAPAIALRIPSGAIPQRATTPAPAERNGVTVSDRIDRGIRTNRAPSVMANILASPSIASSRSFRQSATGAQYFPQIMLGIWMLGCLGILGRSLLGHRRVADIAAGARALTSPEWLSSLEDASDDLALASRVEPLVSEAVSAPITSGFIHPIVILPADCVSWSAERRRIVLIHELAHIARLDYVAQLVATLTCALFWFHPAVWFAAAQLRAEAEHAADDRVIAAGTLGVTYATHLLEIARGDSGGHVSPAIAVGMLRSSRLEGRFRAMLDSTRSRAGVSPRFQAAAASLVLCAMIPLAGLRTEARATSISTARVTPMAAMTAPVVSTAWTVSTAGQATTIASTVAPLIADSTFEKTIDASGDRLRIDLRSGGAIVLHGWDEPRVRLVASLGGRDWRNTRVDLSSGSGVVRLRSDVVNHEGSQVTSHRFELWVPRHMNVEISSAGGSVAINDLSGEFTGHTGGGNITIERANGSAVLSTGGGSVSVTTSNISGSVSTGGGEVNIANVTGGLRGSSGSGYVTADGVASTISGGVAGGISTGLGGRTITSTNVVSGFGGTVTTNYPGGFATSIASGEGRGGFGYGGGLTISKAGGEIVIDDAPNGGVVHTGGGQIIVRSSGGSLAASTGGGDIELQRVSGNASASTGAGDVTISVVNANGTEHSIEVYSGKGRVVLELPADLDARVELESAYTDNYGRRTSIESDFPLDRSETGEWDDRFGSPRKFVRATGVFGRGAGLIRVRTVNGDVVVRRR